jgi:hypothetical protein
MAAVDGKRPILISKVPERDLERFDSVARSRDLSPS